MLINTIFIGTSANSIFTVPLYGKGPFISSMYLIKLMFNVDIILKIKKATEKEIQLCIYPRR